MVLGLSLSLAGGFALADAAEPTDVEEPTDVAGAAEPTEALFDQATWQIIAEARGVAPYAEIPRETPGGGPFVHSELDSELTALPAYAFAAFGYPSTIAQEGAIGIREAPGNVYAGSNSGKYPKKAEIAPAGEAGPYIRAETPDNLNAKSAGAFPNFQAGDISASGGYSKADSFYSAEDDAMIGEAITHVQGIQLADSLRIASFESWIRVKFVPNAEPVADYRIALLGVSSGKESPVEWSNRSGAYAGNKDLVIQGQGVGIGKLVEDFTSQMSEQGKANPVFKGSAHISKPRVYKTGQYYVIAGSGLDLRSENVPRQGTLFQTTGIRFGDVAMEGYFDRTSG